MSASTLLRMPRLSLTPRTVLLSATDACLAASAWTLPAADPSRVAVVVASEVVVEAVAVAAVVVSVAVVVVAAVVVVDVAVVAVVVVASAPVLTALLPATPAPRSRSTKRGLMHNTADRVGIWRVYH